MHTRQGRNGISLSLGLTMLSTLFSWITYEAVNYVRHHGRDQMPLATALFTAGAIITLGVVGSLASIISTIGAGFNNFTLLKELINAQAQHPSTETTLSEPTSSRSHAAHASLSLTLAVGMSALAYFSIREALTISQNDYPILTLYFVGMGLLGTLGLTQGIGLTGLSIFHAGETCDPNSRRHTTAPVQDIELATIASRPS